MGSKSGPLIIRPRLIRLSLQLLHSVRLGVRPLHSVLLKVPLLHSVRLGVRPLHSVHLKLQLPHSAELSTLALTKTKLKIDGLGMMAMPLMPLF